MTDASTSAPPSFWQRRVVQPIVAQLKQGITPEKLALSIALGLVIGVFPILGATTVLCGIAAWRLQLNQPIIQATNYLMTPVHLALLLPFYRTGETLFKQPHVPIFSVNELVQRFSAGPLQFMADYGLVALYGVAVWTLIAVPALVLAYLALRPLLLRLAQQMHVHGNR